MRPAFRRDYFAALRAFALLRIATRQNARDALRHQAHTGQRQDGKHDSVEPDIAQPAMEAALAGSPARDAKTAATCEKFNAYLQNQVYEVNTTLARVQTIKTGAPQALPFRQPAK